MTGQANRTWQLLTAALGSLLIAVILLAAFPADGAFVGCGLKLGYLPVHDNLCTYGPVINGVKSGAVQSIDSTMYLGLASLPSFHIAGGLLLVWAVWHSKFWRWPSLILNSLMGIATVAIAGHYFVDVIGGVLLGAAAIFVAKRLLPDAPPNQEADASA